MEIAVNIPIVNRRRIKDLIRYGEKILISARRIRLIALTSRLTYRVGGIEIRAYLTCKIGFLRYHPNKIAYIRRPVRNVIDVDSDDIVNKSKKDLPIGGSLFQRTISACSFHESIESQTVAEGTQISCTDTACLQFMAYLYNDSRGKIPSQRVPPQGAYSLLSRLPSRAQEGPRYR